MYFRSICSTTHTSSSWSYYAALLVENCRTTRVGTIIRTHEKTVVRLSRRVDTQNWGSSVTEASLKTNDSGNYNQKRF